MENELENIKVGDILLIEGSNAKFTKKVTKVTKAYVFCGDLTKIRKRDGKVMGDDVWHTKYARIATSSDIEEIKVENKRLSLASKCRDINFKSLTLSQLEKIYAIIQNK